MTKPPEDHLKALWKGQQTEIQPMSVEAIRLRAGVYQSRLRARYLAVAVLLFAETLAFSWFAWTARNAVIRAGDLLFIAAAAWTAWQLREHWPRGLPGGLASAQVLVEFHHAELQRQRFRFRSMMINLGPPLAALAVILVGMRIEEGHPTWAHWWPILALTALWVAMLIWLIRRQVRRWRRQLDELDATPLE